jgi:hypothetical protein
MARTMSAKKRLEAFFEMMKSAADSKADETPASGTTSNERLSERDKANVTRRLARKLRKPLRTAFKKAGLDFFNDAHWQRLLMYFVVVIYGGRGPGHPKTWSKRKLRQLREDVATIKAKHPRDSELECCARLKRESGRRRYDSKATTLRRLLQTAKKLDKDVQLLAAPRDDATISDLSKMLKKKS